jgi:hypothetical protein
MIDDAAFLWGCAFLLRTQHKTVEIIALPSWHVLKTAFL